MSTRKLPEYTKANARSLRVQQTDAEAELWHHLHGRNVRGARFKRQHPLDPYILDFYCAEAKLVVDVDGSQHFETAQAAKDAERTPYMRPVGFECFDSTTEKYCLRLTEYCP